MVSMTVATATVVPDGATGEPADVADESLDVDIAEKAESRHPRPAERVAAVLDDVEQVPVGVGGHPGGVGQVARP
ncbi:MAG TPA: hypothetical protein VNO23_19095 [Candidatus Binatia bacterium]|nr:hypothetical protein [Candidatus Binatia bacterium]